MHAVREHQRQADVGSPCSDDALASSAAQRRAGTCTYLMVCSTNRHTVLILCTGILCGTWYIALIVSDNALDHALNDGPEWKSWLQVRADSMAMQAAEPTAALWAIGI